MAVNRELVRLYWHIGRDILAQQVAHCGGAKVIERLAHDLRAGFPGTKGVSRANLMYRCGPLPKPGPKRKLSNTVLDNCLLKPLRVLILVSIM